MTRFAKAIVARYPGILSIVELVAALAWRVLFVEMVFVRLAVVSETPIYVMVFVLTVTLILIIVVPAEMSAHQLSFAKTENA